MSYSIEILNEIKNFIEEEFDSEHPYYEIVRKVRNVFGIELPSNAILDLYYWSGNEIETEKEFNKLTEFFTLNDIEYYLYSGRIYEILMDLGI